MSDPQPSNIPLKISGENDFTIAREFFQKTGFDEPNLCRLLAMEDMSDLGKVQWPKVDRQKFSAPLWACLKIFLEGVTMPASELRQTWGEEVLNAFRALGLVRDSRKTPADMLCPVWLYPLLGFLVASDRRIDPEADLLTPADDVVFPGIYAGTLRFLRLLPEAKGGEALDLCGGTGVGALLLAHTASKAVTADLTARSAFFADFNGHLSGMPIESLCGDLYEPARGQQFDLITAHPPFVPSTGPTMIYRDAGAAGEDVTRGVLAKLSDHLKPGGTCMVLCVACDTFEASFEQRAHEWIGEKKNEFEVLYGLEKVLTVEGVVASMAKRGQNLSAAQAEDLLNRLRSLKTRQFVYGALFIRRLSSPTAPPPFRFHISPTATAREFEWMFAWRHWSAQPGLAERLAQTKPKLRPSVELTVRHLVAEDQLVPAEFTFSNETGFRSAFRPAGWVVPLLGEFNGKRSVAEVFNQFHAAGELPEGFKVNDFAGLVQQMIEKGFFEIEL